MAAASAALAEARARGPPMSPDHPPEAKEDDDHLHESERLSRSWYHRSHSLIRIRN